jgi:hypothetical protein
VWLQFAVECGYIDRDIAVSFYQSYDEILRMLVAMIHSPESWTIPAS